MHIPVHVDGTPIDQADMEIIEQQQAEAREEGGGAAAVVLGWQSIGIPLLVGRILLDRLNVYSTLSSSNSSRYWVGAEKEDWLVSEEDSEEEEDSDEEDHDDDEGSEEGSVLEVQNIERDARPTRAERTAIWKQIGMKLKTFIHLVMLITVGGIMLPILTSVLVELYLLGLVKSKQTDHCLPSSYLKHGPMVVFISLSVLEHLNY
ncbi:hypothetical protein Pst134EA_025587 [Puccinia striiformis f. sp. tritici]|uniref:hypothetical protein n=1 Tax=Puccinia striiformis f. sp. tritici TaxID=168172 RepID=UPI002007FD07|nr:hypothetical protein Pst134EA_025587 [Puccinia striiformis f. sp. tritici]KAH9451641.1 hypothetical protein Pst134EA_025587 [Puccinia striiformis f. sp. tritici]